MKSVFLLCFGLVVGLVCVQGLSAKVVPDEACVEMVGANLWATKAGRISMNKLDSEARVARLVRRATDLVENMTPVEAVVIAMCRELEASVDKRTRTETFASYNRALGIARASSARRAFLDRVRRLRAKQAAVLTSLKRDSERKEFLMKSVGVLATGMVYAKDEVLDHARNRVALLGRPKASYGS